jgi:hypothetical protein
MTSPIRLSDYRRGDRQICFSREELSQLLTLYSSRVAAGEWRDYAIDNRRGSAVFSIFQHTRDRPLFAVMKSTAGGGVPGYAVFADQRELKRGTSLGEVLTVFGAQPGVG